MERLLLGRALGVDDGLERLVLDPDRARPRAAPARGARRRRARPARRSSGRGRSRAPAGRGTRARSVFAPGTSSCVSTAWTPGIASASRDVDLDDPRVRVRAAQRVAPEHPGGVEVARVGELARHLRDGVDARRRSRRRGRARSLRDAVCSSAPRPPGGRRRRSSRSRCSGRGCPERASRISSSLGSGAAGEQVGRRDDQARRAEAALHGARLGERLLHGVEPSVAGERPRR